MFDTPLGAMPEFAAADAPAATVPAVPALLPDPTARWRYAAAYWRGTLTNLLRPHRLAAGPVAPAVSAVLISPALRAGWQQLYGVADGERVPLLMSQGVGTLLYMRLFGGLGFNFRHLVHLQHETLHHAGAAVYAAAARQSLHSSVHEVVRAGSDRVVVTLHTDITRLSNGAPLARVVDRFLIRGLPAADVAPLGIDTQMPALTAGLRRRRPQIDPQHRGTWCGQLALPADWGRRYARVSGDANPVHTTAWGARLFGATRPFAQGLSLRNAVAVRLARLGEPLERLQMTFASPAWLGQTLQLRASDGRFELVGERGELVAFGETGSP